MHGRMTNWESKCSSGGSTLHRSGSTKLVQPGSVEGTLSLAEHRIRMSVRTEMDKTWSDRLEKEDKIVLNKYETLIFDC